jgi:YD repeat-containing protein
VNGNVDHVTAPAPRTTAGALVTTSYNYIHDPDFDANGNPGTYDMFERLGQPLTVTDPNTHVTHFRYDTRGNVTLVISPLGFHTNYTYNRKDQPTSITYPPSNPTLPGARAYTVFTYRYEGGPLQTVTHYDESGQAVRAFSLTPGSEGEARIQDGDSIPTAAFAFDPRYRLQQLVDGNSHASHNYQYDHETGNLASVTYALGNGILFPLYDADYNLLIRQDGRGLVTAYTRAPDDSRITDINHPAGTIPGVHFGINGDGYDAYGRVTHFSDGTGSAEITYDDGDRVLSITRTYLRPDNTSLPPVTISYTYNQDGSRASMTTPRARSGNTYSYWTFTYGYDNGGNLTSVHCPWPQGFSYSFNYDADDRLIPQRHYKATTSYTYNPRGFLTDLTLSSPFFSSSYSPTPASDSQGQVLLGHFYNMQYDTLGNRTQMSVYLPEFRIYDSNFDGTQRNLPYTQGIYFYQYDNKDRLTRESSADP